MRTITLFTRSGCHLCEAARQIIERIRPQIPFEFNLIDIDDPANERWLDEYDHHVPVVHVDGKELVRHRLDELALRAALKPLSP